MGVRHTNIATGFRVASASSVYSSYVASNGNDGLNNTSWVTTNALPWWWQVDLGPGQNKIVTIFTTILYTGYGFKDFTVQGSLDGINWTVIYTGITTNTGNTGDGTNPQTFTFANTVAYRFYRINMTSTKWYSGNECEVWAFKFYEYSGGPDVAQYQLGGGAGGAASASNVYSASYQASNACDGTNNTAWCSVGTAPPTWWKYDLGLRSSAIVDRLSYCGYTGQIIHAFQIQGSNDDMTWATIASLSAANIGNTAGDGSNTQYFNFANTTAYRFYRIYITSVYASNYINVWEFGLFANTLAQTVKFRRSSVPFWKSANPVLAQGEIGYETDSHAFKIGDGSTAWNSLPYSTTIVYNTSAGMLIDTVVDGYLRAVDGNALIEFNVAGTNYYIPAFTTACGCQSPTS